MWHQSFNSIGSHIYNGFIYQNTLHTDNFHNSFEFLFIWDGKLSAIANNTRVELTNDDMLLIAPNIVHSIEIQPNTNCEYFLAVFSKDFISEFKNDDLFYSAIKFKSDNLTKKYLKENMFYSGIPEFYTLKSCLYAICSQCSKNGVRLDNIHSKIEKNFIAAVNTYIFNNLNTEIKQQAIANLLGYERHYFSSMFHKTFQIGFNRYINIYRLNIACKLLTTTNMTVSDIAMECGFANVRNLNRVFKELSGKTPTQYRSSNLNTTVLPDFAKPDKYAIIHDKFSHKTNP